MTFNMTADPMDALTHIAEGLTQPSRRALVISLVHAGDCRPIPLTGASEHTVRALQEGMAPLAEQDGVERYLTPLGVDVARLINTNGAWDLPASLRAVAPVLLGGIGGREAA